MNNDLPEKVVDRIVMEYGMEFCLQKYKKWHSLLAVERGPVASEPVKPYFTRLLRVLAFCLGVSKIVIF